MVLFYYKSGPSYTIYLLKRHFFISPIYCHTIFQHSYVNTDTFVFILSVALVRCAVCPLSIRHVYIMYITLTFIVTFHQLCNINMWIESSLYCLQIMVSLIYNHLHAFFIILYVCVYFVLLFVCVFFLFFDGFLVNYRGIAFRTLRSLLGQGFSRSTENNRLTGVYELMLKRCLDSGSPG